MMLAEDLRRYLHGEATRPRPVGRAERIGRLCRRHPRTAGPTALLVLVFLAGLVGILSQWNQAEEERHKAEVAGREAEAGEAEAEELLGDLVQSGQTVRRVEGWMGDSIWNACRRSNSTANECSRNAPRTPGCASS